MMPNIYQNISVTEKELKALAKLGSYDEFKVFTGLLEKLLKAADQDNRMSGDLLMIGRVQGQALLLAGLLQVIANAKDIVRRKMS